MLRFTENAVVQKLDGREKTWPIPELLENPEPLAGAPLAERNAAMQQVVDMAAEIFGDLSETARLRYDFWKQLKPQRVGTQQFKYTTKVVDTYHWQLTINSEGLFYTDISGEFDPTPGKVTEQLFSDFWFYGPCRPLPDLHTRKMLVAAIRNAFLQAGSPASYQHFTLFEYPAPSETLMHWTEGNEKASDFVIVRPYGIETGRKNWYDGLVYLKFLSFEHFLHLPETYTGREISPAIRRELEQFLRPHTAPPPTVHDRPHEQPGPFFSRGEHYSERQQSSERNAEELLYETAQKAALKARLGLAQAPGKVANSDKTAEMLVSLLDQDEQDSYWTDAVFTEFFNMRNNRGVQTFIIQCLRGDRESYFKKAVDVLQHWGIHGENALTDKTLLKDLNWEDATANDPDFRQALEKVTKIVITK